MKIAQNRENQVLREKEILSLFSDLKAKLNNFQDDIRLQQEEIITEFRKKELLLTQVEKLIHIIKKSPNKATTGTTLEIEIPYMLTAFLNYKGVAAINSIPSQQVTNDNDKIKNPVLGHTN